MFKFLLYGFVFSVCLWASVWFLWGDSNWFLYCLNRSAPFLYIPGILVPLITLIASHRISLTLLSVIPLVLFLLIFWSHLVPRSGEETPNDLHVMTYNILCSNSDMVGIAKVVRMHLPDFIAFQEMTQTQFNRLGDILSHEYPYREISHQVPCGSTAVFSRLPITEHRIIDLKSNRPAIAATVAKNDRSIVFISARLLPMYRARIKPIGERPSAINKFIAAKTKQVDILMDTIREFNSIPVIVACDCNTLLTHSAYRKLTESLVDSATVAGLPDSVDNAKRNSHPYQLDYIFYTGQLAARANYRVTESGGSDHLPVTAHFSVSH